MKPAISAAIVSVRPCSRARLVAVHLVRLVAFGLALGLGAGAARAQPVAVDRASFPVTLSDESTYSIAGYLYHQGGCEHRTLQVVLHGATYNHHYWDAPTFNGLSYSYAGAMAGEGYEVLAIDQLGAGESDHPDGDFFTLDEAASALHQVLASLRRPDNPLHRNFERIVLVGHSLGSITAVYSEGMHGDADGLVLTGLALSPHPPPVAASVIEALLGAPYVTFPAALRTQIFYYVPAADPAVIAFDNAVLSDEVPRGEFVTGLQLSSDPAALGASLITEPVLVLLGDEDATAPGALAPGEAAFYPAAKSITVQTLPSIGHVVNLHRDHDEGWGRIEAWIEDQVREN
jgi:pimeloyl-ACP methyl ester carboxylesterase